MASKKLKGYATFVNPNSGASETFGPDDTLPQWAAEIAADEDYEAAGDADDVADLPVPGPGQSAGEGLTEEEKAEARKKADRERKAAARAAAKKADEDKAALEAAQAAEAQRRAEEEAARLAAQGGGS